MKRTMGIAVVLSALAVTGAIDATAQDELESRVRARRGPGVEAIMQMRERLELTDQQIGDLEAIRREWVEQSNAERAATMEMRSQLAAGQIRRSDMMAFMEDRRDANTGVADQRRERIDAVLTETQLESLQSMSDRGRSFRRGRMSAQRGARGGVGRGQRGFRSDRGGIGRRGARFPNRGQGMRGRRFEGNRRGPAFRGGGFEQPGPGRD